MALPGVKLPAPAEADSADGGRCAGTRPHDTGMEKVASNTTTAARNTVRLAVARLAVVRLTAVPLLFLLLCALLGAVRH
jgi:hypothetical protein